MSNQPLPKPSQTTKNDNQKKEISDGNIVPPPSVLKTSDNKQGTIFNGSRVPLVQKNTTTPIAPVTPIASTTPATPTGAATSIASITPTTATTITPTVSASTGTATASEIKLPPTSLSALSSMSSNSIPNNKEKKHIVMPEKTVLGRPIPQAIRGEKPPVGLSSKSLNFNKDSLVNKKTSPMPVVPNPSTVEKNKKPKFASEKKSIFKYLPLIAGVVVILIVIIFIAIKFIGGNKTTSLPSEKKEVNNNPSQIAQKRTEVPAEQKEIVYWGLWEPSEVMSEVITKFEDKNPGVKVSYVKQSYKDYRERLQTALNSGKGPDVFRFHASWTPMLKSNLYPIPSNIISSKEFKSNYYPIVTDQLVVGGQYVGVPLMYDGLALYYNEDILKSANEVPPKTWAELRLLASKLTVKSADKIERSGLAIGNATNVEHFSDILAVLMLQNGADFNKPSSQETKDAILFYTNFILKDGVWSDKLPNSTVAFARGDVAMMFAPSWRAHEIAAQNPDLNFETTTLPQLSDNRIAWGSYWAEGINSGGKNKELAAKFIGFLSKDENLMKFFSKASGVRSFGEIYPKVSLAGKLTNNTIVNSYLNDAPYAKGWYLSSFTHDNGINDQIIKYYQDGIEAVLEGKNIDDVLLTIDSGVKQVLKQYGVKSK